MTKKYRKSRRISRKASRKTSRKASRKTSRKASRRASRKAARRANRKQRGGNPMAESLKQGMTFLQNVPMHKGGMSPYPGSVDESALPAALRGAAMLSGQDAAYSAIAGMQDGGRKKRRASRKASRKGRKASRKASRKNRKASRKASRKSRKASRKQRGGQAPVGDAYNMLVSGDLEARAGLHPEWKLAATGGI